MAVVRANYIKRGKNERATAKANIRYIQERPGRDKEKLTRTLFGNSDFIGRHETYQFIDIAAKQGRYFYRFKFSPDPAKEDIKRDLHMQKLTRSLIRSFEKRLKTDIPWAGAVHDDHTDIRHVHILAAIPRRLQKYELEALISEATTLCRQQRRELDLGKERAYTLERVRLTNTYQSKHIGTRAYLPANSKERKAAPISGVRSSKRHASCVCPTCHFPQAHDSHGVHECVSCGRIMHKKRELSLQRKGRAWERSI
jgi:hypothetical protein